MRFTLGTHNTLDGAARPTMFADLILFTEAAVTVLDRARFAAGGYALVVCPQQRDLALAYRRGMFERNGLVHYHHVVDGRPDVTPDRGTAWQALTHRPSSTPLAIPWEHRINAAFPPYVHGEAAFRRQWWHVHTHYTLDLIDRLTTSGYVVLAGGDVNTPEGVRGYWPAVERGHHLDRLALSAPSRWRLGDPEYLSNVGSDHPRLRVTVSRTPAR